MSEKALPPIPSLRRQRLLRLAFRALRQLAACAALSTAAVFGLEAAWNLSAKVRAARAARPLPRPSSWTESRRTLPPDIPGYPLSPAAERLGPEAWVKGEELPDDEQAPRPRRRGGLSPTQERYVRQARGQGRGRYARVLIQDPARREPAVLQEPEPGKASPEELRAALQREIDWRRDMRVRSVKRSAQASALLTAVSFALMLLLSGTVHAVYRIDHPSEDWDRRV